MKNKIICVLLICIILIAVSVVYFTRNKEKEVIKNQTIEENKNYTNNISNKYNVPKDLEEIPENYYNQAKNQGSLEELYYDTYESKTYDKNENKLTKRAIIYLPFGYNENESYNVFYLMHGGWSDETTSLGTPQNPNSFKNVIDNAISDGKIKPLIIVCPTYNNESSNDSSNYSLAFNTLTVNYHNELINDLIPAVEGKYSTYCKSTSHEDIIASREHRGFGGFSMGSVTTWYTFINCLNEFKYFLTMSGAMDYEGNIVDKAVTESGYNPEDYFIMAMTGTKDFECNNFLNQINGMLSQPSGNFVLGNSELNGNICFRIKDGYSHNGFASMEYTYNGLLYFWNNQNETIPEKIEFGKEEYRDFLLDNVYYSENNGDIHFNLYIPKNYTGNEPYSLYVTLPGWQGLYFQGVGENIKTEDFGFEAQKYNEKMIILAPQLDDWGETSANQTIALTEYFINNYNIDKNKVYLNGYSGGGETGSIVMGKNPEIYSAYLHCSSQWDGDYEVISNSKVPVYMVIGENDEYYGSEKTKNAYKTLYDLYVKKGLSEDEINSILVLDVKNREYFSSKRVTNQHGGGALLFSHDEEIMGWLFNK